MSTTWMTRAATLPTLIVLACAPAPASVKPAMTSSSSAAATAAATAAAPTATPAAPAGTAKAINLNGPLVSPSVLQQMKQPPPAESFGTNLKAFAAPDRVALIWGYPGCAAHPWVVSVVDLGARAVTMRALATTAELGMYVPWPTGEACYKGTCTTMSVIMPPLSPSLFSGTGTMTGGGSKGLYAGTTGCTEPSHVAEADLVEWAQRLVTARNDEAAAISARVAAMGR